MIVIEAPVPKKQTDSQTEQKQPPALIPESTEHADTSMPAEEDDHDKVPLLR